MNVLITGSEGFIGSHLVEYFYKKKFKVHALVQYNSFNNIGWLSSVNRKILSKINLIFGDIRDENSIGIATKNIDLVINCAALISIPYSYQARRSYVDNNILGTFNILENSLKKKNIKKTIIFSTSEIYGNAEYLPIDENHPLKAQSPYAASKISSEKLTESYIKSFNLNATIIRPFNTYGPRQSMRAVIPTIINQCLFSKKIHIGNIHTSRDFTYVSDLCSAVFMILNNNKCNKKTINIATGKSYKIDEIVKLVKKNSKKKNRIIADPKRKRLKSSEVDLLLGSYKLLNNITGWKPKVNFQDGIIKTVNWFKKNKYLYQNVNKFYY